MRRTLTCAALTLSLLAACGTTSTPGVQAARPSTLLTVSVDASVSDATLAQKYGGTVQLRTETFAVIGNPRSLSASDLGGQTEQNAQVVHDPSSLSAVAKAIWPVAINDWAAVNGYAASDFHDMAGQTAQLWSGGTFLPFSGNSLAFGNVALDHAHRAVSGGREATIAIIDGPMDLDHSALRDSLTSQSDWRDFAGNDSLPGLTGAESGAIYGHATAVAGMALQVAPFAKIMPVQVLDSAGSGDLLNLASGIVWAVNRGADVINLSLGTTGQSPAVKQALQYANQKGVMVVAASGNDGASSMLYPASLLAQDSLGVAVGSVTAGGQISSFSSTGPQAMTFAPGEDVFTLFPGNRAAQWSGTSLAAPVVAGQLAYLSAGGVSVNSAYAAVRSAGTPLSGAWGTVNFGTIE